MAAMADAAAFRAQFPVFQRASYLNAGTEGPLPQRAGDAVQARMELEVSQGRAGKAYIEPLLELAGNLRAGYAHSAARGHGPAVGRPARPDPPP